MNIFNFIHSRAPHAIEPGGAYAHSPSPEPPYLGGKDIQGNTPYLGDWLPLAITKNTPLKSVERKESWYTKLFFIVGLTGTAAFVTTGGRCGVQEAIYHGVPTLCLPLYLEHMDNCAKLAQLGMAIILDIRSFTSDQVHDAILRLTQDERYTEQVEFTMSMSLSVAWIDTPVTPPGRGGGGSNGHGHTFT